MKKVIVTGANGFIGKALLRVLDAEGIYTIAVVKDKLENVDEISLLKNVEIIFCNLNKISDLPFLIECRDIDCCIHLAWDGSFGESRSDYNLQLHNVRYALDLVNILPEMGIKRFVGAGTLAEKDVLNYHITDGAEPNAVSMYGAAKISTHLMTKTLCTKLGIEHIWCYLSNTYGIGNSTNNFINMASRLMLSKKRASFTSGEQYYDFVYITDTVRAIYSAANRGRKNTAYYLGSTKPRKLKDYIKEIRDTIDPKIELFFGEVPFKGIALPIEEFDTSKLVIDTNFEPKIDFNTGIRLTIDWLKESYN